VQTASGNAILGVTSYATDGAVAVLGHATAAAGTNWGVVGESDATSGTGVYGWALASTGTNYGTRGRSDSPNGIGVYGVAGALSGVNYGVFGRSSSSDGYGMPGWVSATTGINYGIMGQSASSTGLGVIGYAYATTGQNYGVYGVSDSPDGWAGWFDGDVMVAGILLKSAGYFRIDHPLDPANRYLNHSFVESPDMMNIYDGLVTLDDSGQAWVQLPDWFEALNQDFRYQLTPSASSPHSTSPRRSKTTVS
jgi:hypothetical protein